MALITSAQSGNFNNTATWTGGVIPGVGDEARAATGHTVTITANATCDEISNAGTGKFVINDGVTLTANVTAKAGTSNSDALQFNSASPAICYIVGNISGSSTVNSRGIHNFTSGTVNVTGNCTGGSSGGFAVINGSTGIINITGNCTAGTAAATQNNSTGTTNITGNCTASIGPGVVNNSTGTLSVIGTIQASQTAAGVAGTNAQQVTILSGPFLTETTRGVAPVYCAAWRWNASPSNSTYMEVMTNDLLVKRNLYTADNITGMPAASNVKSGITYGPSSELTGTLSVTMSPSATDIRDAVWNSLTSSLTTAGSIGERLKNAATVATTGEQLATALTAP